jgi:hypothetical protein
MKRSNRRLQNLGITIILLFGLASPVFAGPILNALKSMTPYGGFFSYGADATSAWSKYLHYDLTHGSSVWLVGTSRYNSSIAAPGWISDARISGPFQNGQTIEFDCWIY